MPQLRVHMLQLKILQATAKTQCRQIKRERERTILKKKKSWISQLAQKCGDKELQDLVQLLNSAFQASSSGPTVLVWVFLSALCFIVASSCQGFRNHVHGRNKGTRVALIMFLFCFNREVKTFSEPLPALSCSCLNYSGIANIYFFCVCLFSSLVSQW